MSTEVAIDPNGHKVYAKTNAAGELLTAGSSGGGPLGSLAVVSGQVTVGVAQVQLPDVVARRFHLRSLLTNSFDNPIALGPTGVTTATGLVLWPGDIAPPLEPANLNAIFAIAGAAGQVLAYLGEV